MTKSLEGLIKPFIAFDRPVDAPANDPDVGKMHTVCFNEEWLPYILGALGALARPETYRAATYDDINLAAQRGMHLLDMFMEECSVGVFYNTILREAADYCGIQWSTDNGDTWNDINLGPKIADLVTVAIQTAITNGILAVPAQPGAEAPIPAGQSREFHVQLAAGQQWLFPVPIDAGDTITVTNATGAWNSYQLGFLTDWNCPNGQEYILGICGQYRVPYNTDPNQNAWHMELMLSIGGNWYLPLRSAITVPGGISGEFPFFQGNQGNLPEGVGAINFDVTVLKASNP